MYSRKLGWILGTFGLAVALLSGCEKKQQEETLVQEEKTPVAQETPVVENSYIKINTSKGPIVVELNGQKAPITVQNFLEYTNAKFYDGTLFHRVIPGFMVQGGGFDKDFKQKETRAPIKNEADNGLKNVRGSLAMARTNDPNSASAQFFINIADNSFLDYRSPTPQGWGYAVFGNVVSGMDIVDKIAGVKTGSRAGHEDVPVENVMIESIEVVPAPQSEPTAAATTEPAASTEAKAK